MTDQPELWGDPEAAKEAAEEAIDRVRRHAEREWVEQALEAIKFLAENFKELTGDAVWLLLQLRDVDGPHEPRAMGAVFRQAGKAGWITPTDRYVPGVRPIDHRAPKRVWRSNLHG